MQNEMHKRPTNNQQLKVVAVKAQQNISRKKTTVFEDVHEFYTLGTHWLQRLSSNY